MPEIHTTRYALMPEVAFSVFACTEWEFRRSMSDFKPGEIILCIQLPAGGLRTSVVCGSVCARMIFCHSVFKRAGLKHTAGW